MNDIWDSVGKTDSGFVKLPWFEVGEYEVEITAVKEVFGQKQRVYFFVVETLILASDNVALPAGERASWRVNMSRPSSPQNVRRFILAAAGKDWQDPQVDHALPPEKVTTWTRQAMDPNLQPLRGKRMRLRVYLVKTEEGRKYSVHHWYPRGNEAPPVGEPRVHPESGGSETQEAPRDNYAPPPAEMSEPAPYSDAPMDEIPF